MANFASLRLCTYSREESCDHRIMEVSMTHEYATLLHRWFDEVWNQKKAGTIHEMMADDVLIHGLSGPGEQPLQGPAEFERFHSSFLAAFPDIHVEVNDVVTEQDKLAGRFTVTGTQMGDLPQMPATGKKVLFTGSGVCRIKDGKFTEVWNEIDFSKMQYDLAPDTPDVA